MAKRRLIDAEILRRYHQHMRAFLREKGFSHRRFRASAVKDLRLRSIERRVQGIRSGKASRPRSTEGLRTARELRRQLLFDDLNGHPIGNILDIFLLQERRKWTAEGVAIPDDVIEAHIHHITTFLKENSLGGRPLTRAARDRLRPDMIERDVKSSAGIASRSGRVDLNDLRKWLIHGTMYLLNSTGGLVGVGEYRTKFQIPEQIKRQHEQYMEARLREMGLEGRRLRSDIRKSMNPVSIENEALRLWREASTRLLAGVELPGTENVIDMNQLRMNIIARRMWDLHSQMKLVTKT